MERSMVWVVLVGIMAGCSSAPVYKQIQKDSGHYNARTFTASPVQVHKAVARMLLDKQFSIDKEDETSGTLIASRYFSQSRNNIVIVLKSRVFAQDEGHQQLYLTAIQTTQRNYIADRTRFLLWVIPLPGGGGKEVSKTKESQTSIEDPTFYKDLFDAIEKNLK